LLHSHEPLLLLEVGTRLVVEDLDVLELLDLLVELALQRADADARLALLVLDDGDGFLDEGFQTVVQNDHLVPELLAFLRELLLLRRLQ